MFLHTDNLQHRAKVRQAMTGDQEWSSKYISKVFPMMERLENVLLKLDSKSSLEQTNTGGGHNLVFYILNIICHVRLKIFFNLHFSRLTSILMLPILIPLISRSNKTNIYFMLLFIFIKICVGFFFKTRYMYNVLVFHLFYLRRHVLKMLKLHWRAILLFVCFRCL